MSQQLLSALFKAAAKKGTPLSSQEREDVHKSLFSREALSERFLNVIRMAGYPDGRTIRDEWLDKYMTDIPKFVRMLESYEQSNGDPCED